MGLGEGTHFLFNRSTLKNQYFGLRHAQSTANKTHIIASDFDIHKDVALTSLGEEQAKKTAIKLSSFFSEAPVIVCSDYKRAFQTACCAADKLNIQRNAIQITPNLRDRSFGEFNGSSADNLEKTWQLDKSDPTHRTNSVESVIDVLNRMTEAIHELEMTYKGRQIILVSHGDPLTILDSGFRQIPPESFRSLKSFGNAEFREFKLN